MSVLWTPLEQIERALMFARGVDGMMLPSPNAADSADTVALLEYSAMIQSADESKPQYRPKWLWNLVSKIALRYWTWKYKGLPEARVREWFESRKDYQSVNRFERWNAGGRTAPRIYDADERTSDPNLASKPNSKKDLSK
jgi:hypothetical protein